MKKIISLLLVIFVFALFSAAFAQEKTAKGRIELGGSVVFDHASYDNGSITDITIMPRMGYFIIPKLALEPTLLMENYSVDPDGGDSYSATDIGALLNVAYHFEGQSGSKFVPFIFAGLGFVSHSGDVGAADEMTMIMPDLGGGIKYFFTDNALIRAEAFYQRVSNANGVKDADASEFGLRAGVSIFIK